MLGVLNIEHGWKEFAATTPTTSQRHRGLRKRGRSNPKHEVISFHTAEFFHKFTKFTNKNNGINASPSFETQASRSKYDLVRSIVISVFCVTVKEKTQARRPEGARFAKPE